MKKCPKCLAEHEKPGIFCSYKCSNSKTFSSESRLKKSRANKKHWKHLSKEQKEIKTQYLSTVMPYSKGKYLNSVLFNDWNDISIDSKRLRVILEQNGECNKCHHQEWLGQPITLEYEHKDGNNTNNSRENVEALCPNCHSQTTTWRGRKNGIRQARVLEYLERNITPV